MELKDQAYSNYLEKTGTNKNPENFEIGRVIAEHKERYIVRTAQGDIEAEITGNMRYTAESREDFPAVGDWVTLAVSDPDFAIIHQVLPRYSVIKRQAVGKYGEVQIIGTNIDYAFIVQAVDRDFNINRLERYLTICNASGVSPIIVLSKTDLADDQRIAEIRDSIIKRIENVPVLTISNLTNDGYDSLKNTIEKGKTYCMLGSSGVGKSTLLNNLSGKDKMKTDAISDHTGKGRHVTSHRELIILENGGTLIDNPGMREVGIADTSGGLEITFDRIAELSESCRYTDCTHTGETGCAVLEALENGEIDRDSYDNYMKMEKEKEHFQSTVAEKRKKEKQFGKMVKNFKKDVKKISDKNSYLL